MREIKDFIKGFKKGMHDFGQVIALLINSALLLIVYIFAVGITSLFAKLSGKHFLGIKISKLRETYWSELNLKKKPAESYYRQF